MPAPDPASYYSITGWPGYMVRGDGLSVRSEYGELEADVKGFYRLRNKKTGRKVKFTGAKLLELAGIKATLAKDETTNRKCPGCASMSSQLALARAENLVLKQNLQNAEKSGRYQKRLNATLWSRLRRLEREIQEAPTQKRKLERITAEESVWSELMAENISLSELGL